MKILTISDSTPGSADLGPDSRLFGVEGLEDIGEEDDELGGLELNVGGIFGVLEGVEHPRTPFILFTCCCKSDTISVRRGITKTIVKLKIKTGKYK